MIIERLRPLHAESYRLLMLEAYERHPEAFTSSVSSGQPYHCHGGEQGWRMARGQGGGRWARGEHDLWCAVDGNGFLMKDSWQIRKAVPEDSDGLRRCMELAYTPYLEPMNGRRLAPMDLDYLVEIRDFPSWVVQHEGMIVGGLIMIFGSNCASIANIAVHPRMQGQGLGGTLMNFAEVEAKKKKYSELRLVTHVLLVENVSLYLHLGWAEFDRDDVRVYMEKKI
jgi:N-acetylglutamate synthase-like GNAT family acetyltransferase